MTTVIPTHLKVGYHPDKVREGLNKIEAHLMINQKIIGNFR